MPGSVRRASTCRWTDSTSPTGSLPACNKATARALPHTFDSAGYVHLLERVRRQPEGETIYAPDFDRQLEEPIAGAIPLHATSR